MSFTANSARSKRAQPKETLQGARQRLKEASPRRSAPPSANSAGNRTAPEISLLLAPIVAGGLSRAAENTAARLKDRHRQKVDHARREVEEARKDLLIEHQIGRLTSNGRKPPAEQADDRTRRSQLQMAERRAPAVG